MATWVLIPCLKAFFAEFDRIAPRRDKASDGSVGDTIHQQESSDHNPDETGTVPIHDADKVNEVHAVDVDNNLNESDLTMEKVVQFLLGRCRSGKEKRLRYIIYNRRIWSASSDWVEKKYTGSSPHTEHAHFSASYVSAREADTASWHLEEIPVALTAADKTWITNTIVTQTQKVLTEILEGGAVSRGLRGQPNNLSDTERSALGDVVAKKVWGTQMVRPNGPATPGGSTTTTAGDYQRYNDVVNKDTAENAADRVIAALSDNAEKTESEVQS